MISKHLARTGSCRRLFVGTGLPGPCGALAGLRHLRPAQNLNLLRTAIERGYTQPCVSLTGYGDSIADYVAATPEASVFARPFDSIPDSIAEATREALRAEGLRVIGEVVNPAYQAFADFFAESYRPACRTAVGLSSLPGGREAYGHALRYYTSLDTDAPAIHALGRREVGRIRREMEAVMA